MATKTDRQNSASRSLMTGPPVEDGVMHHIPLTMRLLGFLLSSITGSTLPYVLLLMLRFRIFQRGGRR